MLRRVGWCAAAEQPAEKPVTESLSAVIPLLAGRPDLQRRILDVLDAVEANSIR